MQPSFKAVAACPNTHQMTSAHLKGYMGGVLFEAEKICIQKGISGNSSLVAGAILQETSKILTTRIMDMEDAGQPLFAQLLRNEKKAIHDLGNCDRIAATAFATIETQGTLAAANRLEAPRHETPAYSTMG